MRNMKRKFGKYYGGRSSIAKKIDRRITMNTVTVLIACAANELDIPCRLFEDLETGKQACDKIFGMEGELSKAGDVIRYKKNLDRDDKDDAISEQLFTNFYYGCGGPYVFVLKDVPFDTKFIGFDLD